MKNLITAIGLMSGTSCDGIDASIIKSDGEDIIKIVGNLFFPYKEKTRFKIRRLKEKIDNILDLDINALEISSLEKEITTLHVQATEQLIKKFKTNKVEIDLIGFHGQTIFHSYRDKKTKQLGDGKTLSNLTGLNVVYKFRENDLKNGGQGAPLATIFHRALQKKLNIKTPVVFVNIGGISNVTYLGKNNEMISFDSGPGNFLIDKLVQLKSNDKIQFDKDGKIAFSGRVNKNILNSYLCDSFYKLQPPKSLDVNNFNLGLVSGLSLEDSVTTLSEVTSTTITDSLTFFFQKPWEIILCGGGRKNKYIHGQIKEKSKIKTTNIDDYKINGDFIESQAFAYLAIRSFLKKPITFPKTTGVFKACTGGKLINFR